MFLEKNLLDSKKAHAIRNMWLYDRKSYDYISNELDVSISRIISTLDMYGLTRTDIQMKFYDALLDASKELNARPGQGDHIYKAIYQAGYLENAGTLFLLFKKNERELLKLKGIGTKLMPILKHAIDIYISQ